MERATQYCAMLIMFVILYFYLNQKRLKLFTSKAFMKIWGIVFLSILLNISSMFMLDYQTLVPMFITKLFIKMYISSLVWIAIYGLMYVCMDAFGNRTKRYSTRLNSSMVGFICAAIILPLPVTVSSTNAYNVYMSAYGPAIIVSYIITFIFIAGICGVLLKTKKIMNVKRREAVTIWMLLWAVAAIVQFFNNRLILLDFNSALGLLVIFVKLENPENNIDKESGLFNMNAFSLYMRQLCSMKKNVSVLMISYEYSFKESISYATESIIHEQILEFMDKLDKAVVFQESEKVFLVVFDNEEDAKAGIEHIEERFSQPWGTTRYRKTNIKWCFIPSTELVNRPEDILSIFTYAEQNRNQADTSKGVVISDDIIKAMYSEKEVEVQIIRAMEENRLEVFYQPIFSVKKKIYETAEALVRIRDEQGNIIPPAKFIHVAEKKGIIIRLGEEVFEQVCKFISEYEPYKYGVEYIEVNLSVIQCAYENLADDFIAMLEKYNVEPSRIVLEITESASVREKHILLRNMEKLKAIGVKFALDDFGTGQSNLNYIVEMPVDIVKFDNTMTKAYFDNGTAKYVMNAAMQMIQGMDLKIVSEGIEEKAQYKAMEALGIDFIQGYYFSKPVEKESFIELIKQRIE